LQLNWPGPLTSRSCLAADVADALGIARETHRLSDAQAHPASSVNRAVRRWRACLPLVQNRIDEALVSLLPSPEGIKAQV